VDETAASTPNEAGQMGPAKWGALRKQLHFERQHLETEYKNANGKKLPAAIHPGATKARRTEPRPGKPRVFRWYLFYLPGLLRNAISIWRYHSLLVPLSILSPADINPPH